MFKLPIDLNAIKALELFAGKDDVLFAGKDDERHYLNGIWVCAIDARTVRVVATDGYTLAEHRVALQEGGMEFTGGFPQSGIIPRDAFKALKGFTVLSIEPGSKGTFDPPRYSINDGERVGKLIDGTFPDIDRIWPSSVSLEATHLDPDYVARVGKAAHLLAGKGLLRSAFFQNGSNPTVFKVRDDFAGLIMPERTDKASMPEWTPTKSLGDPIREAAKETVIALRDLYDCAAAGILPKSTDDVLSNARKLLTRIGIMTRDDIAGINN